VDDIRTCKAVFFAVVCENSLADLC
jgi:hypothetical protein